MTKIRHEPAPIQDEAARALLELCARLSGADPQALQAAATEHLPHTPTGQAVTLLADTATQLRLAVRALVNFQLPAEQRWQLADPLLRRAYLAALSAVTEDQAGR